MYSCKAGQLKWGAKLWLSFDKGDMEGQNFLNAALGRSGGWAVAVCGFLLHCTSL